jgi:hypothetical protein
MASEPVGAPLCPSSQPELPGAVVFGVVGGTVEEPRVSYLTEPQPATADLLALADPVEPTEVFRFAGRCVERECQHFDGARCSLVRRIVELTPTVVDSLPPCRLRPRCRWWLEEGRGACLRCPVVVTRNYFPTEAIRLAADPSGDAPGGKEATTRD